jgi:predicted MFS family arabinose efflux permease
LWILPRKVPDVDGSSVHPPGALMASVREVLKEGALRGALMTVLTSAVLSAPLITFCPVLVKDVFHGGAGQFSSAMGAFGVGGLLGGIGLLTIDARRDRRPLSAWSAIILGLMVVLSAINLWAWALPLLLVAGGVVMTASNASANALLQSHASAHLRGQTASLFMLAMRGGVALGSLLTGVTVQWMGVRHALLLNGILAILAQLCIARRWLRVPMPQ